MVLQKISKDSRRGIVIGSNSLTPEKIAAGAVSVAAVLAAAGIGGLFSPKRPKNSRAGAKQKKKKPAVLAIMPVAAGVLGKKSLGAIKSGYAKKAAKIAEDAGISIENAEPIGSESELMAKIGE